MSTTSNRTGPEQAEEHVHGSGTDVDRAEHPRGAPHAHGHEHTHGHQHGAAPGRRAQNQEDRRRLGFALAFTSVIAAAEALGGYFTHSLALLSDAGHMVTDISAIALGLLALWFSGKPANVRKTYGYYRLEILSALANGVLLVGITGVIVYEAWVRFRAPEEVHVAPMLIVASIGLLSNVVSLLFLHRSHSMTVRGAFLHVLGDTLSSVGVIAGALVMWFTGWFWVDPLISVAISLVIVVGAYRLVKDAADVLLEATPAHVDMEAVRQLMGDVPGVTSVHDLHVWTISSGIYALSAHLVVTNAMSCNNDEILSAVKHQLFDQFGIDHTTIQIESERYAHVGEVH